MFINIDMRKMVGILANSFLHGMFSVSAIAQQDISVRSGDYEIFYSAFNTSFLSPEVASAISVPRAKNRGLVNISIIWHDPQSGSAEPVAATTIDGSSFNLIHRQTLDFKEVVEPGARYYLAPFKISNDNELISIDVEVLPAGAKDSVKVHFQRRFFLD